MPMNIDQLTDYYAQANFVYIGAGEDAIKPGAILRDSATNPKFCGLVVPLAGSARVTLNNTPYLLKPGEIFHATPGTRFDREVVGKETWRCARLYFSLPEKEVLSLPFFHRHFNVPTGISLRITDMAQQLLTSNLASGSTAVLRRKSLFHNLIEEIALSAQKQYRCDKGGLVEDAVAFMHENYVRQFTITQLAAQYDMDGKQFSELFHRHVGRTPLRYLNGLRIERSKELLQIDGCTVIQAAEAVGYTDPYYFSKSFKKITGMWPTEFQAMPKNFHPQTEK